MSMEYVPRRKKKDEDEELRKKLENMEKELSDLRRMYGIKEKEVEDLKGQVNHLGSQLRNVRIETPPSPQYLQFELDDLIDRAKSLIEYPRVTFSFGDPYFCPYCNGWRENGCTPSTKIEGNAVVYGIECKKKGFQRQGELPIPRRIRSYI